MPVQHAFSALQSLIEREMEDFKPDAVVYLTAESAMGYLMDTLARQKGIVPICLQTTFLRNSLLVHSFGRMWWKALRDMPVPPDHNDRSHAPAPLPVSRLTVAERFLRGSMMWASRAERALRAFVGAPSFDTRAGLLSSLWVKGVGDPGYFPDIGTEDIGDDVPDDFILVALHRPVLDEGQPDWLDLLRFAMEATPENMLIVVRPHPDEPGRTIPADLLKALRKRGVRVSRPGKGADLDGLLKKSRALLTISSAAGVQALRAGVTTFTIGPAFYAREGMAVQVDVHQPQSLRTQLSSQQIPDQDKVNEFIAVVREKYAAQMPALLTDVTAAKDIAIKIQNGLEIHG